MTGTDDKIKVTHDESTTYTHHRCVRVTASDPTYPGNAPLEAVVGHSTSSSSARYTPSPTVSVPQNHGLTRAQWEIWKQLVDRAWAEYDAKVSAGGEHA